MTTALEGGEGSASSAGSSLPPGKTRYPFYRRLGGPQGWSGQVRKLSPPPGFDPRTAQPVASHYTDWATWSTTIVVEISIYDKIIKTVNRTILMIYNFWDYCALMVIVQNRKKSSFKNYWAYKTTVHCITSTTCNTTYWNVEKILVKR
jgi:hypothetical protein